MVLLAGKDDPCSGQNETAPELEDSRLTRLISPWVPSRLRAPAFPRPEEGQILEQRLLLPHQDLAREHRLPAHFWLNLQARYDLEVAKDLLGERLSQEVHVLNSKR